MARYHTSVAACHNISEHITDTVMAHIGYSCGSRYAKAGNDVLTEPLTEEDKHSEELLAKSKFAEQFRIHPADAAWQHGAGEDKRHAEEMRAGRLSAAAESHRLETEKEKQAADLRAARRLETEKEQQAADLRAAREKTWQQAKDHESPLAQGLLAMSLGKNPEYEDKDVLDPEIRDMVEKKRAAGGGGDHRPTHYLESEAKRDRAEQRAHPFRYRLQQVEKEKVDAADKLLWETKRMYETEEEFMLRSATSEQQDEMTEPEAYEALMTQDLAIWDLASKRYRDRTLQDDADDDEAAREDDFFLYSEQSDKRREKFYPSRTEFINLVKERRAAKDKHQMDTDGTSPSKYVIQDRREDDRFHLQMTEKEAREWLDRLGRDIPIKMGISP